MRCPICGAAHTACGEPYALRFPLALEGIVADTTWTAPRRLYLNKEGAVVEADDPERESLLVAAGGHIPLAQAQTLGLVVDAAPAAPASEAGVEEERPDDGDGGEPIAGFASEGDEPLELIGDGPEEISDQETAEPALEAEAEPATPKRKRG